MPDYEGESRELTLDKSMSYSMFTYDVLRVTIPSSPIKSVSTSKEDMLTIFYDEGSHEITVMSEVTGKVKITVRTSNGKKLVLALTINDPNAIRLFQEADPGINEPVSNTGEFRVANKFYVLCASGYREETWGDEPDTDKGYGSNPATFALRCSGKLLFDTRGRGKY